jgi:hypothetical protein
MKAGGNAATLDKVMGAGACRVSQKVQALIAKANYEPPRIISFPTGGLTEITPVTMTSNL